MTCPEPPDPPSNITMSRSGELDTKYSLHWQPPASSMSGIKSVDNYTLTITPLYSPSPAQQTFTTNDTTLSVHLNHSTNYTVSLRASNCAGNSIDTVFEITKEGGSILLIN